MSTFRITPFPSKAAGRLISRTVPLLLAFVAALALPGPARASEPVTIAEGHVDYAARLVDGHLESTVKDGSGGATVWRDPDDVLFVVNERARRSVPDRPAYGFLGAGGTPTWLIPEVQEQGILWLGWNTEEIAAGDLSGDVTFTLEAVEGPGRVAIYQSGPFGPMPLMNSGDGLPDSFEIPAGVHAHANWAFSQRGEYRLTLKHSATIGSTTRSDTHAVRFRVGSDPLDPAEPGPDEPAVKPARVKVGARTRLGHGLRTPLRLTCRSEAGRCDGTVVLRAWTGGARGRGRLAVLSRKTFSMADARKRTVHPRAARRTARRLRSTGRRWVAGRADLSGPRLAGTRTPVRIAIRP